MADISALVGSESLRLADTVSVPTRVYFPSGTLAPDVTPPTQGAWNEVAALATRKLIVDGRKRGTAAASVTSTSSAANPEKHLHGKYVSPPLRKQTISGSVRGQFRCLQSATGYNGTLNFGIYVVTRDGQTLRGTLLALGGTTTTSATPPEFATSLTNRRMLTAADATPIALSAVNCEDGDRLVIEIGINDKSTSATQTAGISFGDNTIDLPENDTTTAANDPWVEFNSTIGFQTQLESLRLTDSGQTGLMFQGWIKVIDTVTAQLEGAKIDATPAAESLKAGDGPPVGQLTPLVMATSPSESLKITDTASAGNNLGVQSTESLRLADTLTASMTPLQTVVGGEALTLADTVTAERPFAVIVTESIRLIDVGGGQTSLLGTIRITDEINASLSVGSDLSTSITEEVRPSDSVTAARGLTATPSEALAIADLVTASRGLTASVSDVLTLTDTATPTLDPLAAVLAEALGLTEAVTASFGLSTVVTEALRLTDTRTATLHPLETNLTDAVRIGEILGVEIGSVLETQPEDDEVIRIGEHVTVALTPLLTAAAPSEALRLADVVSQPGLGLSAMVGPEVLRLADIQSILAASANEQIILSDIGRGATQIRGTVRIQDGPPIVAIGGQLGAAPSEALRLSDTVVALRTPLAAPVLTETLRLVDAEQGSDAELVADEWVRVTEQLAVAIGTTTELFTSLTEGLSLADTVTARRTLEVAASVETLRLADTVSASRDHLVTLTEAVRVADTVTASRDHLASLSETLRVADATPVGRLDPLLVFVTETFGLAEIAVGDRVSPNILSVLVDQEQLAITDLLVVVRGLTVAATDTLLVVDTVIAERSSVVTLEVVVTEAVAVSDVSTQVITPLFVAVSQESLTSADAIASVLALVVVVPQELIHLNATDEFGIGLDLSGEPGLPPIILNDPVTDVVATLTGETDVVATAVFVTELRATL